MISKPNGEWMWDFLGFWLVSLFAFVMGLSFHLAFVWYWFMIARIFNVNLDFLCLELLENFCCSSVIDLDSYRSWMEIIFIIYMDWLLWHGIWFKSSLNLFLNWDLFNVAFYVAEVHKAIQRCGALCLGNGYFLEYFLSVFCIWISSQNLQSSFLEYLFSFLCLLGMLMVVP